MYHQLNSKSIVVLVYIPKYGTLCKTFYTFVVDNAY